MKNWLWLLLGVAASAVSWTYMHRVLLPWEHYVNVDQGRVRNQMGDLYPRWVGTRELLLNRRNPYGPDISHEIQNAFYGHPIEQTYDKPESEVVDEQRFVYPVYVVFLLAPTVHADFENLQAWAPLVFAALIAVSVVLWLAALRWRPAPAVTAAVILFVLASPQIAQGLRLRQFGLIVSFLVALASWCAVRGQRFAAGACLALATIKPQMVALCIVWFLIWTVGHWKKRWPLAAGVGVTLGVLIGAGELLLPGWPKYFLEGLNAYRKYFPTTSPLRLILGNWIGGILSVLLIVILLVLAWSKRRLETDSPEFLQVLAVFFVASTLVLPLLTPYNQVLLLLPVLMLIRDWSKLPRWGRVAFGILIAWPFVVSLALLVHLPQLDSLQRTPLLPSALTLLLPFLILWLMFVRRQQTA